MRIRNITVFIRASWRIVPDILPEINDCNKWISGVFLSLSSLDLINQSKDKVKQNKAWTVSSEGGRPFFTLGLLCMAAVLGFRGVIIGILRSK